MKLHRRPLSRAGFVNFELIENAIPSVVEIEDRHIEHQQWVAHSAAALEPFWQFVRETSFHSCLFLLRELPTIFYSRVHSFCFLLTFASLNSMIIKFLVCSPAFATLQLLFAGTQAHREGTAVSQSLSNSWSVWPNITTSRSRPSCGGDHFVLPGSATVDIRTPSVSDPSLLTRATGLWLSASRF
jgi:hypothetical protein